MNKTFNGGLAAACLAGAMSLTGSAFAANDGNLGAVSQGDLQVSVGVPSLARVSDLDDIVLNYTVGSDASGNDDFCVFENDGDYSLVVTSTNPGTGNVFQAVGTSTSVTYDVLIDTDLGDGNPGASVLSGATVAGTSGNNPVCSGGMNANIAVTFPETDNLDTAAPDTYVDTVTLTVTAN